MPATSVDLIDLVYTGGLISWLKEVVEEKVAFDYSALLEELARIRSEIGYRKSEGAFGPAAVDLMSERQQKFVDALQHRGIAIEKIDYRHAYVSRPVDKDVIYSEPTPLSVSSTLAFLLGRLAERSVPRGPKPEVLVVSGSFDLYLPLRQFVEICDCSATVVYFESLLDPRWAEHFRNDKFPIRFYDLSSASLKIVGLDLKTALTSKRSQDSLKGGFGSF